MRARSDSERTKEGKRERKREIEGIRFQKRSIIILVSSQEKDRRRGRRKRARD